MAPLGVGLDGLGGDGLELRKIWRGEEPDFKEAVVVAFELHGHQIVFVLKFAVSVCRHAFHVVPPYKIGLRSEPLLV